MTKEEMKKALEAGQIKLIRAGSGYSKEYRASYDRYSLYVGDHKIDHHNTPWISEHAYYVKRSETLSMTVWGMSQEFEAKYVLVGLVCPGISCEDNNRIMRQIAVLY
jgi:hypothetical protein